MVSAFSALVDVDPLDAVEVCPSDVEATDDSVEVELSLGVLLQAVSNKVNDSRPQMNLEAFIQFILSTLCLILRAGWQTGPSR